MHEAKAMVILGLDWGERRIGAAVSDALEVAAHVLPTIPNEGGEGALERIAELVQERGVELIVVGMPTNMDGSAGPQAHKVRGFLKRLRRRLPRVPVETMDERLSSAQAHRSLSAEGVTMRRRAERVDGMAAQVILTRYLQRRRSQQDEAQP
jgi:putative Holliday junction resolvase